MKINNPETLIEFVANNELTFTDLNNILSKTIYSLFINSDWKNRNYDKKNIIFKFTHRGNKL